MARVRTASAGTCAVHRRLPVCGRARDPATLAPTYHTLHARLIAQGGLPFNKALAFLSHARLADELATKEQMSAAQISRVLSSRDSRVEFSWQVVEMMLAALGIQPSLDLNDVMSIFEQDKERESLVFADADEATVAEMVGRAASELGFPGDLQDLLMQLAPTNEEPIGPYLQILHWAAMIAEFYDHPISWPYEFNPRGDVANWLFRQYPGRLAPAGNPILNNAKSIDRLDEVWARTRGRSGAGALKALPLARILLGAKSMGFHNRRGLAEWLRLWLARMIRLYSDTERWLPDAATETAVSRVLDAVIAAGTSTAGVVEQRIVDAIVVLDHPTAGGWHQRGLGESVNASNLSAKKFGDCEFLHVADHKIRAYEAHGGTLTTLYVDAHIQSLGRVLEYRRDDLAAIADLADWDIEITFVAQALDAGLPTHRDVGGVRFKLSYRTFADIRPAATPALVDSFSQHVHSPLNEPRTPQIVRDRYAALAGVALRQR